VIGANLYGRYDLSSHERSVQLDASGGEVGRSEQDPIDSARRDDVGVFTALSRDWRSWGVAAGLRQDWIRASNEGGTFGDRRTDNSDTSGFVAVTWRPLDDLELSAQAARGFRDALLSDRYFSGQTGRGTITGNPDLEPETSRQLDLAVRYRAARWQLAGYGYLYRIIDLIERYRDGDDYFFRNRGEGEVRGVEVEGSWALTDTLELQAGAHWIEGEVLDDGTPTDDVPPTGGFVVLRSEGAGRWSWMVRGAAFAADDDPGPSERPVPGYGVVDAAVGFRLSDGLSLQLLGRNLLDKAYQASSDVDAVLAAGRSLQLTLRGDIW
jgi:outer membrane receptor protein involved in Fe transport